MEDLLDSWPGTLLVATHDRYLLERVTDQQYAVVDHRLRHLPGGVDQYLQIVADRPDRGPSPSGTSGATGATGVTGGPGRTGPASATDGSGPAGSNGVAAPRPTGAQARALSKELAAIERRLERLQAEVAAIESEMVADSHDYTRLTEHGTRLQAVRDQQAELEERWLELSVGAG
jgi:hypothetical protein